MDHPQATEPFGIYVHVPFCEQKCAYCDFFTVTDPDRKHPMFSSWLQICLAELRLWIRDKTELQNRQIDTVFFGGGTPSLLPPEEFTWFMDQLRAEFNIAPDVEVSLETQPGTLGDDDFKAMTRAGINRFSIGVQTFNPRLLSPTARRHTVEESENTLCRARETGAALSLDLICALPGQTFEEWQDDLERALMFDPDHMSVYEMTYHAGTQYFRLWKKGHISESDEAVRIAMFRHTDVRLTSAGYNHYEISNYAKTGYESRHNRIYWTLGNFVGLGAGAHSYIAGHRWANPRSATDYARAIKEGRLFARNQDSSDPDITLVENLTMALRLTDGVNLDWAAGRLGQDIRITRATNLAELRRRGWIEITGATDKKLKLTEEGRLQADTVAEFLL
jgi:oxygen-independent coproporphyrinogen-3 oxidase